MKKLSLISFAVLACLSLSACGTNSKQAKQDSEASSLKIANSKLKKKAKKQSSKKKHSTSSSSAVSASSQQQQTQSSNGQPQASQSSNGLPPASDIHDFVNRYGVSPALWKMQHGMNAKDALMSTPEEMRTTGENQDVTGIQQGYVDPNTLGPKN